MVTAALNYDWLSCAMQLESKWFRNLVKPFNLTKWDGRTLKYVCNVISPDRMSECSRYQCLMCDVWLPSGRCHRRGPPLYLRNVCHRWLSPSSVFLIVNLRIVSHTRPWSGSSGWLPPPVISCRVIILHISHHCQFLPGQRRWEESFIFIQQQPTTDRL